MPTRLNVSNLNSVKGLKVWVWVVIGLLVTFLVACFVVICIWPPPWIKKPESDDKYHKQAIKVANDLNEKYSACMNKAHKLQMELSAQGDSKELHDKILELTKEISECKKNSHDVNQMLAAIQKDNDALKAKLASNVAARGSEEKTCETVKATLMQQIKLLRQTLADAKDDNVVKLVHEIEVCNAKLSASESLSQRLDGELSTEKSLRTKTAELMNAKIKDLESQLAAGQKLGYMTNTKELIPVGCCCNAHELYGLSKELDCVTQQYCYQQGILDFDGWWQNNFGKDVRVSETPVFPGQNRFAKTKSSTLLYYVPDWAAGMKTLVQTSGDLIKSMAKIDQLEKNIKEINSQLNAASLSELKKQLDAKSLALDACTRNLSTKTMQAELASCGKCLTVTSLDAWKQQNCDVMCASALAQKTYGTQASDIKARLVSGSSIPLNHVLVCPKGWKPVVEPAYAAMQAKGEVVPTTNCCESQDQPGCDANCMKASVQAAGGTFSEDSQGYKACWNSPPTQLYTLPAGVRPYPDSKATGCFVGRQMVLGWMPQGSLCVQVCSGSNPERDANGRCKCGVNGCMPGQTCQNGVCI